MADVLIAYTSDDRVAARGLGEFLSRQGYRVKFDTAVPRRSRGKAPFRPELQSADAVIVVWSDRSAQSKVLLAEAELAAAMGKLTGTFVRAAPPPRLSADLQILIAGPVAEPTHIASALEALDVPKPGDGGEAGGAIASPPDNEGRMARAWAFVDGRGDPELIQQFLASFPSEANTAMARLRLAELAGADEPDGNTNRPLLALLGAVCAGVVMAVLFLMLMPSRPLYKVQVAAGGADGIYSRMLARYNERLKPLGVELVAHPGATSSFSNVQLLADGKAQVAFVKGGLAGALRDPDFMHDERMRSRGKEWEHDWGKRLDRFQSLGRVSLEPLWVFTYGSSETNRLNELDGEPIHVGSMESGSRTLAGMLLERNGVRFKPGLWLEAPLTVPKPEEMKPLGEARALFLLQPAETALVQALLQKIAPENQFDKSRIIRSAIFSPRGKHIAVALGDKTARLWDAGSGHEEVLLNGHTDEINDIAFSPDERRLATASDDDTIRIWDTATGAELASFAGSGKDINSVAFSPDGRYLVSGSDSDHATVREVDGGKVVFSLSGHDDDVTNAAFSPDGRRIVTASRDHTAIVWDASDGKLIRVLAGHNKAVASAQFSPDGKLIVTASWDGTARLWDAETGRTRLILSGHTDLVRGAEFSPDGRMVITASWDDSARVWDVATGAWIRTLNGLRSNVNGVGFSPDGKVAMTASQDGHVRLWDTTTWANVADFTTADRSADAGKPHGPARRMHLLNFESDADAYVARYPFMSKVQLPKGAIALEPPVPAEPVTLLATSVAVVVDKVWADNNKSAARLIADAIVHKPLPGIDETTRKPRLFYRSGQFPTLDDPEYEVSPLAPPIYKSGDIPFLLGRLARMNWVPFNVAAWIDEHAGTVVLSLIPLLGILVPLVRAVPAIYTWTVRRRILYWYRRLQALERRLDFEDRITRPEASTPEIERIDSAVSKIKVPLNYSDQYYDLRSHIELVRQRLAARAGIGGGSRTTDTS